MKCPLAFCDKPDEEFKNGTALYRHFQERHTFMSVASYLVHKLERESECE